MRLRPRRRRPTCGFPPFGLDEIVVGLMPRYLRAAEHDDDLGFAFLRGVNLLARFETLMTPTRLVRVMRPRRPRGAARSPAQPSDWLGKRSAAGRGAAP